MKIRNYKCNIAKNEERRAKIFEKLDTDSVFSNEDSYIELAKKISSDSRFIFFPVSQTLEAELLNATSDKTKSFITKTSITNIDDLLAITNFNFEHEQFSILKKALSKNYDKEIAFNINGPYTLLSQLLPIEKIFVKFRKEKGLEIVVFNFLLEKYFLLLEKLKSYNIKLFSIADPICSVDIVGPKVIESLIKNFFIKIILYIKENFNASEVFLCPKLGLAFEDFGLLKKFDKNTDKLKIYAHTCINKNDKLETMQCFSLIQ